MVRYNIRVDYNKAQHLFYIEAKSYLFDLIRELPNRRYNGKLMVWTAPAISMNIKHIKEEWQASQIPGLLITEEAVRVLNESVQDRHIIERIPFPKDFPFKMAPKPYQLEALDFAHALKTVFFNHDPGLGKTKTSLDFVTSLAKKGTVSKLLIICPNSIKMNWVDEIGIHLAEPFKSLIVHVAGKVLNFEGTGVLDILVVAVESIGRALRKGEAYDMAHTFLKGSKAAIVIDEVHTIKNIEANCTKNCLALGQLAEYKVIMTGTPVSQGTMDLYSLFEFLDPNILGIGDYGSFKKRYAVTTEVRRTDPFGEARGLKRQHIVGTKNLTELLELIKPWVHTVRKKDVLDIPDKVYQVRRVPLSKKQTELYNSVKRDGVAVIKKQGASDIEMLMSNILAIYTSLQQITAGYLNYKTGMFELNGKTEIKALEWLVTPEHNPKLQEVLSILDEIPEDESVVIWAKYKAEVRLIMGALEKEGISTVEYSGDLTQEQAHINATAFKNKEARVIVATYKGAVGHTWTVARYTIYFSQTFRLLTQDQSEDRVHRLGQDKGVMYYILIGEGTIDEVILKALASKKDLAEFVQDYLKTGIHKAIDILEAK